MTINFWGLGMQAVNVLILVWLLSHFFWRPVTAAITRRQETADALLKEAETTQTKADATLAELSQAREGISAERSAALEAAKETAAIAARAALAESRDKATELLAAAKSSIEHGTERARKANITLATALSMQMAAKLLSQLNGTTVHAAFIARLTDAIASMDEADRTALMTDPHGLEIVTAADMSEQHDQIRKAVQNSLGESEQALHFCVDPDLIAGVELRSTHVVLHNSWQADLLQLQNAMNDAT